MLGEVNHFPHNVLIAWLCTIAVIFRLDSPGVPPSAAAHELFRGFSYVAPSLLEDNNSAATVVVHSTQSLSVVNILCTQLLTGFFS
jgi:hypothetical protein